MKPHTSLHQLLSLATIGAAIILGTSLPATSVRADTAAPAVATDVTAVADESATLSSTEIVLRLSGRFSAMAEAEVIAGAAPLTIQNTIGFLAMAANNRCLAILFRFRGLIYAAAYFDGRADGFELAATLTGL